jgi:glycosyltransferase involved in cell wall biosynthesis
MYPSAADPAYGTFVASQIASVRDAGVSVEVEFIDGRKDKAAYLRAIFRIGKLARTGFDAVHAHYGLTGVAASFHDLPCVVTLYGDDLLGTPSRNGGITWGSRLGKLMTQLAVRRADELICMSMQMRDALPRQLDRQRAHVIPNGVDLTKFSPGNRDEARALLGKNPGERLVLFPSTPTEVRKRLDLASQAMESLSELGIAATLWIVSGVRHDELPPYYRAADCLLLTSDWEGSPNVVKEALCCDLPVVSVDAGDVRTWIPMAEGSRLVERDAGVIARALRDVLIGRRRVDGTTVRAHVDLRRIGHQVVSVYKEAIVKRHRATPR